MAKNMAQKKLVKVNLGCGTNFIPGFINVDRFIKDVPKEVNYVDADIKDLPFEKDSVDYIICDNVLEHLPQADVPVTFRSSGMRSRAKLRQLRSPSL